MHKLYFISCKECSKFHEETGLCILGYVVPETLAEAESVVMSLGFNTICRDVEKGDLLADIICKETCKSLRRKEVARELQSEL